jgi:hypothetical protein
MPGKAVHFLGNGILKALRESNGENHRHHADGGCRNGKPDDKPGKGMLAVKGDSPGYEGRKIQNAQFSVQK